MPGLAILSPINEAEELSPYRARFAYARFPTGQRSPIGYKGSFQDVRDTLTSPSNPEVTVDDLWIYDCYVSEDTISPGGYPRSPSTPSHNRSVSLPATTANYVPANNIPLIKEPTPQRHSPLTMALEDETSDNYMDPELPDIDTTVYSSMEFAEYSPLEQDVFSIGEVMDQLAAAVDEFSGIEHVLTKASALQPPPEVDEDVAFWFVEALNMFVGDCMEVAVDLMQFSEFVEALLAGQQEHPLSPAPTLLPHRASFSEHDMKAVLDTAANIPDSEIVEALAELEATPPSPLGKRLSRDRPPSLKLSTSDAVLLQTRLQPQPRSRMQSVGAVRRFTEHAGSDANNIETARMHRAYVIYGENSPIDDGCSAKSIVDYGDEVPNDEPEENLAVPRPRPGSGQTTVPRPMSSPTFAGKPAIRGRPPSLSLSSPRSPRSSHSTSSSVSSIFSALPRSSVTTSTFSPDSPRQSYMTFEKPRFQTSSVKFKKMFTNIFKNKDKDTSKDKDAPRMPALRSFGKRMGGSTGSIDATLSTMSLSSAASQSTLVTERDPFAASPPPTAAMQPSSGEFSPLDGYSSMFNPLKAASRYPPQPLFGGVGEDPR